MKKNNTRVKTPTIYQMEATECGAASLAMVFGYYGKFLPLEQMRIETGVSRDGCNAKNILRAARKFGLEAKGYRKSLEGLLECKGPCIIHWNFNHFVVWEGVQGKYAYINDPAMGRRKLTIEEVDDCYTGVTLMFSVTEKFEKTKQKRDRENCVVSYLLLKKALKQFGIESFEILVGENGKPFLKDTNDVFFNISHTASGVAVVADESLVGIDIQDVLDVREKVIERCFSESEKEIVFSSDCPEKEFTRLWTLKESAVKYNGETVAQLKNYCFENNEKSFIKYGRNFTTFERKNLFISVCGTGDFSEIIEIKTEELL